MTFRSDETGKHLRAQTKAAGVDERARAMQALSCGYGTGSQGALASLLLATLGGSSTMGDNVSVEEHKPGLHNALAMASVQLVAEPMQPSANETTHDSNDNAHIPGAQGL